VSLVYSVVMREGRDSMSATTALFLLRRALLAR
jgi:hypothetical protein